MTGKTANHHRQTGAFVYEREKISQFFTFGAQAKKLNGLGNKS
jgi:hypothetical protein